MNKRLTFSLSKLKSQCKTKYQRLAFNQLMSSFAKATVADYVLLSQAVSEGLINKLEAKNAKDILGSNIVVFDAENVFVPKTLVNLKDDRARIAKYLMDLIKNKQAILSSNNLIIIPKEVFAELFKKGNLKEAEERVQEDSEIENI